MFVLPRAIATAFLTLLLVPVAVQAASPVQGVFLDRIEEVDATTFTFVPCEDRGVFVPLEGGFRFEERQTGSSAVGAMPYPGGYLSLGCGEAILQRTAPLGARSVEVSFLGDRAIQEFNVQGSSVTRPGRQFNQELHFQAGTTDRRIAYMDAAGGPQPPALIAPDRFLVPGGLDDFTLTWSFRDTSYFVGQDFPDALSGQDFQATVQAVNLRFPDLPAGAKISTQQTRQGELLLDATHVRVDLVDPGTADLRIQVASGLTFAAVRGPAGLLDLQQTSRAAAGPNGFNRDAILVEAVDQGGLQVTIPRQILGAAGAGEYDISFTSVETVHTIPWLLPIVFLVLLIPLPFAALAYHHVRRFELQAFGGFRRSARNLRVALIVACLYYFVVLASHFAGSRFELMAVWPIPLEALLVYVQVAIAIAAFLALFQVAQELYHMTVPRNVPTAPVHLEEIE